MKIINMFRVGIPPALLILCHPNVSTKMDHGTGSYKFSTQQKGGLVSVAWEHVVSFHGVATS